MFGKLQVDNTMHRIPTLYPKAEKMAKDFGYRIKLARLRRKMPPAQFAERIGVDQTVIARLEAGDPRLPFGVHLRALTVLGLDGDVDLLAKDDVLGRKLQDLESLKFEDVTQKPALTD